MPEEYPRPKATGLSKRAISKLGERVATQLEFGPGDDILEVVQRLGGKVAYHDFWELDQSTSGSIVIEGQNRFTIHLALHTSPERDRFTIGHELGHYVCHFLWPRNQGEDIPKLAAARYGSDRAEWEANWFAAAFLMPEQQFIDALRATDRDIAEVASRFKVSYSAAAVRANALAGRL